MVLAGIVRSRGISRRFFDTESSTLEFFLSFSFILFFFLDEEQLRSLNLAERKFRSKIAYLLLLLLPLVYLFSSLCLISVVLHGFRYRVFYARVVSFPCSSSRTRNSCTGWLILEGKKFAFKNCISSSSSGLFIFSPLSCFSDLTQFSGYFSSFSV